MNILTMAKNIFSDLFISVQNLVNISMFERLIIFLSALILFSLWTYKGDKHILDYSKLARAVQSHEATCLLSLSTLKLFHLTHIHSLCCIFHSLVYLPHQLRSFPGEEPNLFNLVSPLGRSAVLRVEQNLHSVLGYKHLAGRVYILFAFAVLVCSGMPSSQQALSGCQLNVIKKC